MVSRDTPATLSTSRTGVTLRLMAFGGIGDAILLTPSLRAMATSNPRGKIIVWTANRAHESVFRHNPYISSFRYISRTARKLHHMIRAPRWRPYIDTDYSRTLPSLLYTRNAAHILAETLNLTLQDITPELFLTHVETSTAADAIRSYKRPAVAIHVRASSSPNKNWLLENWKKLVSRNLDMGFIQVGNRDEPVVPGAKNLLGTGLRHAFAVIKHCDAFVGVDSGLGHAATALRTPAVILFGATSPIIWGHAGNANLYTRRYCSPCIDRLQASPCPFSTACMSDISVERVEEALKHKLSLAHGIDKALGSHIDPVSLDPSQAGLA